MLSTDYTDCSDKKKRGSRVEAKETGRTPHSIFPSAGIHSGAPLLSVKSVDALLLLALLVPAIALGADVKMADGQRVAALIEKFDEAAGVTLCLTSGERKQVALREVASIFYSGRSERLVRTGDQKFIFNAGGHICGAVEELKHGATIEIASQSLGRHVLPLALLRGFTALAMEGRAARLAEDLMRDDGIAPTPENAFLDHVLDRRGVPYSGVVERFTPVRLEFEHDEQLQQVRVDTFKVAGVRLAEAARDKRMPPDPMDVLQVGVLCRDGSYVVGRLVAMDTFQWKIRPAFDPERLVIVPASELVQADVLGGRAVFLANLEPIRTEEETIIAPPQPFRRNANSQGESLDIGGYTYAAGLGVHARSKLTYRIGGKFREFLADVAIDGRLEKEGSVVFVVAGDGRELYRGPLVTGRPTGGGLAVRVPVEGIEELTLSAEPTDDLDQADVANWGAARLLR
ncbi:MAG: hypothetical protein FJ290_11055 [Planctomycetes bacterium]|nr:hypothetical protein [Planctomycetota bacterium]